MSRIRDFLARGWDFIDGRQTMGRARKIKCPHAGCGLVLAVSLDAPVSDGASEITGPEDLFIAVSNRRNALGLTQDDIDYCAGLTQRHTQKVEDSLRLDSVQRSLSSTLALLMMMRESGADKDAAELLDGLIAQRVAAVTDPTKLERLGRRTSMDIVLLVVSALGGKVKIEWGQPPAITKRLVKYSGQKPQLSLDFDRK